MPALAPGHHLYRASDGGWRWAGPTDRFARLTGPEEALAEFARVLHSTDPATTPSDPAVDELVALFERRDLLLTPKIESPRTTPVICIDGDNPLATAVAGLLEQRGEILRDPVDKGTVIRSDVVISCAEWLPDSRWRQLQQWCRASGTAWHRCHAEDQRFYLGPMWIPNAVTYDDVRGRRLAASPVADELEELWRHLDDAGTNHAPVPWPDAAGLAVIAGLLVAEVLGWIRDGRRCVGDVQLGVQPHQAIVDRHPVLPLPVAR